MAGYFADLTRSDRKIALPGDRRFQIELSSAVAMPAVGVEPFPMLEQTGESSEVDHWASVASRQGRG